MEEITWTKYVPHALVSAYLAAGWKLTEVDEFLHHDHYSFIMEWAGAGDPPKVEGQA